MESLILFSFVDQATIIRWGPINLCVSLPYHEMRRKNQCRVQRKGIFSQIVHKSIHDFRKRIEKSAFSFKIVLKYFVDGNFSQFSF